MPKRRPSCTASVAVIEPAPYAWGDRISFHVETDCDPSLLWLHLQVWQGGEVVAAGWWRVDYVQKGLVQAGLYSPTWTDGAASARATILDAPDEKRGRELALYEFPVEA